MTLYKPATDHSNSIVRPNCSKCGTATLLFGIESDRPGYELLTFECPNCKHIERLRLGKPRGGRRTAWRERSATRLF